MSPASPGAVGTGRGFYLILGLYLHTLSTMCSGHPRSVTNSTNSLLLKLTVLWVQDWGWPWPGSSSALRGIDQRPPGGPRVRVGRSGVSLTCLAPWWTPLGAGLGRDCPRGSHLPDFRRGCTGSQSRCPERQELGAAGALRPRPQRPLPTLLLFYLWKHTERSIYQFTRLYAYNPVG